MTLTCACCRRDLGEKCPTCGARASQLSFAPAMLRVNLRHGLRLFAICWAYRTLIGRLYACNGICKQVLFVSGLGGAAQGCCDECRAKLHDEASSPLARAIAKQGVN